LAFSPDSKLLAAGCGFGDNEVHVWDLEKDTETRFAGHSGWIVGLAFSRDGQTLASASTDQTLRLWDVARKAKTRRFQGHTDEVWAIAWSPDGQNLVTGGKDGSVRYWDRAASPPEAYGVVPASIPFWGLAFLPDSKTFLTVTRPEGWVERWAVPRWDSATVQEVERLPFLESKHSCLDLSNDGRWVALGDANGNIQVWDIPAGRLVTNLVAPEPLVFAVNFSPQGSILCCGSRASNRPTALKLWAVDGWREIRLHGLKAGSLVEPAFSPDDRILAIGHDDGTTDWWELATGRRQVGPGDPLASSGQVAFSPVGRLFATAAMSGRMRVWDVVIRRTTPIGRGYRNALHDVAFSPDARRLVATGTSPKGLVKFWDVETGRDVATLLGEPGWFCHIGFSPDGNTLFAASLEGIALLWRAPSWAEIEAAEKKQQAQ
jgi:WD40 repeat protein